MPNRILTTHVGSLPRPHELLDMMKARLGGEPYDRDAYEAKVRAAVSDIVGKQIECGIDIVTDGEQSKPGFFTYIRERLTGFEPRPGLKVPFFEAEVSAFPEYYKDYFARAMGGGGVAPMHPDGVHGADQLCGKGSPRARPRQPEGRFARPGGGRSLRPVDRAERGGIERVLPQRRGILSRGGRRAARRVQGHRRRRLPSPDRRSVSNRHLLGPALGRGATGKESGPFRRSAESCAATAFPRTR